jgi:coiled-coil and C2 domain-containing protein 2A
MLRQFESMETEDLMVASDKYLIEVLKKYPKRNYLTTVVSLEGIAIFVTRYIKPLKPPDEILAGGAVSYRNCFSGLDFIWHQ